MNNNNNINNNNINNNINNNNINNDNSNNKNVSPNIKYIVEETKEGVKMYYGVMVVLWIIMLLVSCFVYITIY